MYYTGIDPRNGQKVYVCRNPHEKLLQRALIQYRNPSNYELVREALVKAGREDLIGFSEKCLIRPRKGLNGESGKRTEAKGRRNEGGNGPHYRGKGRTKGKTIRNVHKRRNSS